MAISAIHGNREASVIFPNMAFIHDSQRLLRLEPSVASQEAGDGAPAKRAGLLWWCVPEPLFPREGSSPAWAETPARAAG